MNTSAYPTTPSVVCFGEVLWDIFPDSARPGGAPMNVAYHLRRLGINSEMISRIGNDDLGLKLLQLLKDWQFNTAYIGMDPDHPTSTVDLFTDEHNEVTYTINEQVAWDYIPLLETYISLVQQSDVLVFGSLAMRHETTCQTLMHLLDISRVKVMDLNIRMPFFDIKKIQEALHKTDILKLNKAELNQLIAALDIKDNVAEDKMINALRERFGINEVLLTNGGNGAWYFAGNESFFQQTYPIKVLDTVGSGDAFLAGFLAKRFSKEPQPATILEYASAVGAFNTTKTGACPHYTTEELDLFMQHHKVLI